jgi:DNA modification methylase
MIYHGDLFHVLPLLEANSVDSGVVDSPYGIGFMAKKWDTFKPGEAEKRIIESDETDSENPNLRGRKRSPASSPSAVAYNRTLDGQREFQTWCESWGRELFRVLKPGAYLLACGAPRSYHRMTCGLEEAGFEIRDCLSWLYGQGFPKSVDVERVIDMSICQETGRHFMRKLPKKNSKPGDHVCASTEFGKLYHGCGTALKPSWEPIVMARKPLEGATLAENVLLHNTGFLNISECWIELDGEPVPLNRTEEWSGFGELERPDYEQFMNVDGRWPGNVILTHAAECKFDAEGRSACVDYCPVRMLDEQSGVSTSKASQTTNTEANFKNQVYGEGLGGAVTPGNTYSDHGGASRFFYVAKPPRSEKDAGLYDLKPKTGGEATGRKDGSEGVNNPRAGAGRTGGARNFHPTVKPVELMRYCIRLITPRGGTVIDCFLGSGTTGVAARLEDRQFIGVEREADYVEINRRRISEEMHLFYGTEELIVVPAPETENGNHGQ